MEEFKTKLHQV